jgi:Flavin containing amine oxidoreductase
MPDETSPDPAGEIVGSSDVVVVGGGIGGIYCARELAKRGYSVTLLEIRPYLGGRIETLDLRGFSGPTALTRRPAFKGECGPMRFELALQPRFGALCDDTGIKLADFPPPKAAPSPTLYSLADNETYQGQPLDALQLLTLGVLRMFGQETTFDADGAVVPKDEGFLKGLEDDQPKGFEELRKTTVLRQTGVPLHNLGFWNALSQVMSQGAVETIKERGSFFHLLPENPSAVEWGIFWLRIFKLPKGGKLHRIPGGVRLLTERLEAELDRCWRKQVRVLLNHEVVQLHPGRDAAVDVHAISREHDKEHECVHTARHVVLALPREPLKRLAAAFPDEIAGDLDSVVGFRLLKAFLCMRRPAWWGPKLPEAQAGAWTIPTRELHYFEDESGDNAMMMLYSDEPNAKYWTTFIENPARHDRAQIGGHRELKHELVRLLLQRQRAAAADQLQEQLGAGHNTDAAIAILLDFVERIPGLPEYVETLKDLPRLAMELLTHPDTFGADLWASVTDYAIRDWARAPDGAGCHAWAPGARSWEVRARLRAFPLRDGGAEPGIHICGEAYSDYQGFIEGALRSAADAVATITGEPVLHSA